MKLCIEGNIYFTPKFHILETGTVKLSIETGLMSDGWTDMRGRHLINFLVNSPAGTYFLQSVDASSEVHSATILADLLEEKIEDIGKDNVIQVASKPANGPQTAL
jgi:hypothetical protein